MLGAFSENYPRVAWKLNLYVLMPYFIFLLINNKLFKMSGVNPHILDDTSKLV
jgi:hypothetical protein